MRRIQIELIILLNIFILIIILSFYMLFLILSFLIHLHKLFSMQLGPGTASLACARLIVPFAPFTVSEVVASETGTLRNRMPSRAISLPSQVAPQNETVTSSVQCYKVICCPGRSDTRKEAASPAATCCCRQRTGVGSGRDIRQSLALEEVPVPD